MDKNRENRKILLDASSDSLKDFDKTVMIVSSGAFAIAFAFIDKVVDVEKASFNWLFLISLCCFAFPVISALWNFLYETRVLEESIKIFDDHPDQFTAYRENANKKSSRLRVSQMWLVIIGSVFLLLYIVVNTKLF